MSSFAAKIKEEVRKILIVALFFSTGFCLAHVANSLLVKGSTIELASLTRAIVGGFIVAKVLLIVDLLPFADAFPGTPLVRNVLWKASIYTAASVLFLYLEPLAKNLFRGAGLYASHARAWHELMSPRTWATVIWLAMLLVVFVSAMELAREIGDDQLKTMFFGRAKRLSSKVHLQKAA